MEVWYIYSLRQSISWLDVLQRPRRVYGALFATYATCVEEPDGTAQKGWLHASSFHFCTESMYRRVRSPLFLGSNERRDPAKLKHRN